MIKDTEAAKAWFQKSANQGNAYAYAYYHLALMYERGDGEPKSASKAAGLYREALARRSITQASMLEHAKSFIAANP